MRMNNTLGTLGGGSVLSVDGWDVFLEPLVVDWETNPIVSYQTN